MNEALPENSPEQAPRGADIPTGEYRVEVADDQWWWSDETYRIHGFRPGDVVPTTALVLAHKHPEDRGRVAAMLVSAARTGGTFSSLHRIADARGEQRVVAMVGRGRRADDGPKAGDEGPVVELAGFFMDLTATVRDVAAQEADVSIQAAARSRRDIEQAKAIIRVVLSVGDDEAFDVLRQHSNVTNVPVRVLAQRLLEVAPHVHRRGDLALEPLLEALTVPEGDPEMSA